MITNRWYAVMDSGAVKKGRLVAAKRFGKELVFFRTASGEVAAVTSLCAHRGASLCNGWIENVHGKWENASYN